MKKTMKKTMKQHSFTSQLASVAVVFGIALSFASCANEDVVQNPTNSNEDNDKNLTTFVAGSEAKTRTSMEYPSGKFYWEAGDYIYVKDDDGVLQKSVNAPVQKTASFNYEVPGKFSASSSYKVYYLGKNGSDKSVSISTTQSQTAPDNTEHFGTAGDYGTATANKVTGKNQFAFELKHYLAYLVFQPYVSNTTLHNCYLTKVEVTSDNDIVGTYTVNPKTGSIHESPRVKGKQIVLTTQDTKSGISYNDRYSFPLTNNAPSRTTNGAYMVIKPGTHILRVCYSVIDIATNTEGSITKILPSKTYIPNVFYDITANLNVPNYDGTKYYMWDALQIYWAGHEWNSTDPWQPTLYRSSNSNFAKSNADPRWYHEMGNVPSRFDATQSCASLPNVNEMSWYCMFGDPRWDKDELWTALGHLYKGGMWFKKKSVLQAEHHYDTEKSADGSTDLRTEYPKDYSNNSNSGRPSDADADKYFFLPALGRYIGGTLLDIKDHGYYWSSSAYPWDRGVAYNLCFYRGNVQVNYTPSNFGFNVGAFE